MTDEPKVWTGNVSFFKTGEFVGTLDDHTTVETMTVPNIQPVAIIRQTDYEAMQERIKALEGAARKVIAGFESDDWTDTNMERMENTLRRAMKGTDK